MCEVALLRLRRRLTVLARPGDVVDGLPPAPRTDGRLDRGRDAGGCLQLHASPLSPHLSQYGGRPVLELLGGGYLPGGVSAPQVVPGPGSLREGTGRWQVTVPHPLCTTEGRDLSLMRASVLIFIASCREASSLIAASPCQDSLISVIIIFFIGFESYTGTF